MKRVILHIGQPKTGSTALQHFFHHFSEHLSANGIGYFRPKYRYIPWGGRSNADFLIYEALRRMDTSKVKPEVPDELDEDFHLLQLYAERHDVLLLSEETIFQYTETYEGHINGELPSGQKETWQYHFLSNMRNSLMECLGDDAQIDVFLYLRRQDLWALSKWKEDVRNTIPVYATFDEALTRYGQLGFLDYEGYVKTLEQVFGKTHIVLSSYEMCRFDGGNIFYDFMHKSNLLWDRLLDEYAEQNRLANISLTLDAAFAMRLINSNAIDHNLDRWSLYVASIRYSTAHPEASGRYPMPRAQRVRLVEKYAAGNRSISKAYLGDAEALFDHNIREYEEYCPQEEKDYQTADKIILTGELAQLREYIKSLEKSNM